MESAIMQNYAYEGNNNGKKKKVPISVNDLAARIKNSISGPTEKDAKEIAEYLLNFFGYAHRIIDNTLDPEDRDVFYKMEEGGILDTKLEEIMLPDGREWTICWWILNPEKDGVKAKPENYDTVKIPVNAEEENIYESVFQQIKDN